MGLRALDVPCIGTSSRTRARSALPLPRSGPVVIFADGSLLKQALWHPADHLPNLSAGIIVCMLVFARVGAMVMLLPVIGENGVPSPRPPGAGPGHLSCPDADRGGQPIRRPTP